MKKKKNNESAGDSRVCSKCGSKMMRCKLEGGMSHGQEMWSCTNYPKCDNIESIRSPIEQALMDALIEAGGGNKGGS